MQLPEVDDAGQLVGALLAQVLMIPPSGVAPDGVAVSSVLAGLSALDVLTPGGDSVAPADYAVVLTAGAFAGEDAAERNAHGGRAGRARWTPPAPGRWWPATPRRPRRTASSV